jgi:Skp family chaperone for outer membrane proteins
MKSAFGLAASELRGKKSAEDIQKARTQRDLSMKIIAVGVLITLAAMFAFFYFGILDNLGHAIIALLVVAVIAFLFTNPVGWAILAVTAVIAVIAAWNKWGATAENLKEKLDDLKSELSDIESELDAVNQELETTQERMAELLSMPSLSFTEQKELENLEKQNEELERQVRLLEAQAERKRKV